MGLFDIFRKKKKVKADVSSKKETVKPAEMPKPAPKTESVVAEEVAPKVDTTETKSESPTSTSETKKAEDPKKSSTPTAKKTVKTSRPSAETARKIVDEPIPDVEETESEGDVVTESKPTRTGKFEVKRAKDGRYHFNLYASNHILIARSQVYSSSSKAMQGINSVIANAPKAKIEDQTLKSPVTVPFPKWEIYIDNGGKYRFRLCATNGSCICHSRGYTTKANCKNGIESITRFANDAEIKKVYLDKK